MIQAFIEKGQIGADRFGNAVFTYGECGVEICGVTERQWRGFEQHMTACPECDRQLRRTESIRRILRQCCRRMRAPQSLRSRIALALPHRAA